jgi:hypothetical protein
MRLLVIGSDVRDTLGDFGDPVEYEKAKAAWPFRRVCLTLGKLICRGGHEMMVLSSNPSHADRLVLEGYQGELGKKELKRPILVSSGTPDDGENHARKIPDISEMFPQLKFREYAVARAYPFNRIPIVQWADALIIIGGRSNARQFAEIALALQKTIVPIRSFGGEAENLWSKLEQTMRVAPDRNVISQEQLNALAMTGFPDAEQTEGIFTATEAFYVEARRDRFGVSALAILAIQSIVVLIWFGLFLLSSRVDIVSWGQPIAVVMLVVISVAGVFARAAYAAFVGIAGEPNKVIRSRYQLFTELALVAPICALSLIAFFLNAAALKGDEVKTLLSDSTSFNREALLLSVMGLTGAFLLERTMERMRGGKTPLVPTIEKLSA